MNTTHQKSKGKMKMKFDSYGEGVNGHYYNEDLDYGGEYESVRKIFYKNPLYYHIPLFKKTENPTIIHETKKAILFETEERMFWIPKKLLFKTKNLNNCKAHRNFVPQNIK